MCICVSSCVCVCWDGGGDQSLREVMIDWLFRYKTQLHGHSGVRGFAHSEATFKTFSVLACNMKLNVKVLIYNCCLKSVQ